MAGRARQALRLIDLPYPAPAGAPPHWQVMIGITITEIHITTGDTVVAHTALVLAIIDAEAHRLPHQLQRAQRCAATAPPDAYDQCLTALARKAPGPPNSRR